VRAVKHNRLLGEPFVAHNKNIYRREDIIVFAKGFSVTGLAAFIMIIFGV
jgi:hypothetical protein